MDNGASSYRRFLEGEKEAIVEILSEYSDGLVLFIYSITGNISLAEEITEDVFCELLLKRPGYNSKSSFKTWLYAIARYKAFHLMKRRKRFSDAPVDELYDIAGKEDLERDYLKTEQKIQLHKALERINEEYSQVLHLTFFEGFSNSETAKIMDKSNRQIENLIYRAKKALKNELEKEGFVYEEL
ncbi:MAG TPA: RNA polymerase sigma factor [Ruminococcus sp.]|nr:RNA polymerase sigma factor [Ruminococcus sp.]